MNLEQTSTSELVKIIKEQAEEWKELDLAVLNQLNLRSSWFACPKEDLALIDDLYRSVLRLRDSRPPPKMRYIPGEIPGQKMPPLPPYYQGKVSLSQAINKSSAQTVDKSLPKSVETISVREKAKDKVVSPSPWPSGLFYLSVFVIAFVCLTTLAWMLGIPSIWIWPGVTVGSFLATTMIGALQLMHDGKIQEKNFLILMKLVFQKMPLIERLFR
jgi:hypothetical protein